MRHPSLLAALCATAFIGVLCPVASAATITVDDDGAQCPAAPVDSVQRAVDLAAPGDTIVICPGDYEEGVGSASSNAVTSTKALTIRGAGADLVRIRPRALQPSGSSIAKPTPDVATGTGSILVSRAPLQLSGVTIDGAGVVAEAGVVLIDAPGSSLRRVRVTNLTTSEAASASTLPGGYRSTNPGYGLAVLGSVAPGVTSVSLSRIDRYNGAGIVVDGGANVVKVSASQIVGRSLCQSVEATGDCDPLVFVRTGPLFGQDGLRAVNGGAVQVSGSFVSQNQVAGGNAPEPGTVTNNANLVLGAGLRTGPTSSVTRSNVVDNAYGMFNAGATQALAENNWWGLRYPTGPGGAGGTPPPVNAGPAISPATNPPIPENPVNGAPVPDGLFTTSDLVDFFPFRDGQQSDPSRGQYPIVDVPGPQPDAAPTVTLSGPASAAIGRPATLSAEAADDFGVARVVFFDGAAQIGSDAKPPYTASYTPPAGTPCTTRQLTAVAEDSSGQTAGASTQVLITGCPPPDTGGGGGGTPAPGLPTITLAAPAQVPPAGARFAFATSTPAGLRSVDLLVGRRTICRVSNARGSCRYLPTGAEVGRQVVRAVVTDALGRTAQDTAMITVTRFTVRRLSVTARRTGQRVALTIRLDVPARSRTSARRCPGSSVNLLIRRDGRSVRNARLRLSATCVARATLIGSRGGYTARVGFPGSKILRPATTTKRFR